ncbi:MAG TPA: RNA polymerase sigma factor [Cyclobacteriaceae bacterium]
MYAETLLDIAMVHADKLIMSAKEGDDTALNKLVGLWYNRIYNYAFKYFNDHDLATEVSQRTFISMYKNIGQLEDTDKFKPWLYKIVTNFCHQEERRQNRNRVVSFTVSSKNDKEVRMVATTKAVDHEFNPERSFQQKELSGLIMQALGELINEQKTIVIMKEYEGLKFWEIAEILNLSESTVKTRLYAGLNQLRILFTEKNITKETVYYEL